MKKYLTVQRRGILVGPHSERWYSHPLHPVFY
jgi:hypothetical protein